MSEWISRSSNDYDRRYAELPSELEPMLSADVIDYIFSLLQSDHATLRQCSAAHPLLAQLAQRHQYVYLALQNYPTRKDPKFSPSDVLKLFAERPELVDNVVQGLYIELLPLSENQMNGSLEAISSILSTAVEHLPKLSSVTLTGRSPVAWRNLDKEFQRAFLGCIRLLSVTEVSIQDIVGFDLMDLVECASLKHLSLQGRFRVSPQSTSWQCQLESLSLTNFRPLYNILHWYPLRSARVLDFHSSNMLNVEDYHTAFEYLVRCVPLTCLRLDLADSFQTCYDLDSGHQDSPIPLRTLRCLKHVTFHSVSYIKTSSRKYFSAVPDIVRSLKALCCLESMTLRLHFEVDTNFFLHREDVSWIRSILTKSSAYITLHISAAKQDGTKISPSEIDSLLRQDEDLMDMVNGGKICFTAEGHFCKDFSCCSQDISAYILR